MQDNCFNMESLVEQALNKKFDDIWLPKLLSLLASMTKSSLISRLNFFVNRNILGIIVYMLKKVLWELLYRWVMLDSFASMSKPVLLALNIFFQQTLLSKKSTCMSCNGRLVAQTIRDDQLEFSKDSYNSQEFFMFEHVQSMGN